MNQGREHKEPKEQGAPIQNWRFVTKNIMEPSTSAGFEGKARTKSSSNLVRLDQSHFDPEAEELVRTWHTGARDIFTINAYPNGITLSSHAEEKALPNEVRRYAPQQFQLRFRETRELFLPSGKYHLFKDNFEIELERRLSHLREHGRLQDAVIYFGVTTDPFHSFPKKFEVTMKCLSLFEIYRPSLLVVQTRSPLVISALPTLKLLGNQAVVSIHLESPSEQAISRYTPGQPKIFERIIAADGLRQQGIKVQLCVSPILPYGEIYRDAWDFAEMLDSHADYISLGCITGTKEEETKLKFLPMVQRLVADGELRILRPYAYRVLYYALKMLCPEKLLVPLRAKHQPAQLDMFAA